MLDSIVCINITLQCIKIIIYIYNLLYISPVCVSLSVLREIVLCCSIVTVVTLAISETALVSKKKKKKKKKNGAL